jgi:hypothetical protein
MSDNNIQPILFSPSEEQQKIIDALKNKQNVIVNAVAGSGKTTTILGIAKQMPDINILQITYNKALQLEVEEKVKKEKLINIKIYTYHGIACSFYDYTAWTDDKITDIITNDTQFKPRKNHKHYSIIVIDEAQDMTELYFKLVYKFLKELKFVGNLLILGDNYQGIYEFKGADTRYLTFADKIFKSHQPFVKLTLNTSYRLTNTTARFINEFMMYDKVNINAPKQGEPVIYHRLNQFSNDDSKIIANYIIDKIVNYNAKADDFFIIAPSITKSKILKNIENNLVDANIQCYVPMSDESKLKDKILKHKVVFTTYHQSKGRERPYCIVLGFDTSYYKYYNKTANMYICENILYVAVSRASKQLILVEDYNHGSHPFLRCNTLIEGSVMTDDIKTFLHITKESLLYDYRDRKSIEEEVKKEQSIIRHNTSVTNFTKFIKNEILDKISILVDKLFITFSPVEEKNIVLFPNDIQTSSSTFEEVFDIIGVTLPSMLEITKHGKTNVLHRNSKIEVESMLKNKKHKTITDEFNKLIYPCITINDWLHLGNFYLACTNKLYYKIKQIKNYDWITDAIKDGCHNNMKRHIVSFNDLEFEDKQEITFTDTKYGQITLCGRFDAIDNDTLWEFKISETFSIEHKLQLIIYSYMWQLQNNKLISDNYSNLIAHKDNINENEKKELQQNAFITSKGHRECKLMSIRTGEILKLNTNNDACLCVIGGNCNNCDKTIKQIIELLLYNRYFYKEKIDNDEFITNNINKIINYLDIIEKYKNSNINNVNNIDVSGYSSNSDINSDTNSDINSMVDIIDFEDNSYFSNNYYSRDSDDDEDEDEDEYDNTDFNKFKVNAIIDLCNKEFTDDNRIKNLKKKKKQELIDILLILIKQKKDNKIELDF